MVGAMRWLDAHAAALAGRPVYALNFDGAGAPGRLVLLERYGFGRPFSPLLSRLARAAAKEMGERVRGVLMPPAMGIDAIPFAHRGIDCLTLSSGQLGPAVWAVHSAKDRPELLDPATLERAAHLAAGIARQLTASALSLSLLPGQAPDPVSPAEVGPGGRPAGIRPPAPRRGGWAPRGARR
jgi:Zn-dependent M28 family amino/carboxypeptidase